MGSGRCGTWWSECGGVMPEDTGFLRAIACDPDDDTARLAYADWLDERDQHNRAEFIRAQIAVAGQPVDTPQRRKLAFLARQLLDANEGQWLEHPDAFIGE